MMTAAFIAGWAHQATSLHGLADALARELDATLYGYSNDGIGSADVLIGWSMGGMIAQQRAGQKATRPKALVLIASTPRFCAAPDFPIGTPESEVRALSLALRRDPTAAVNNFIDVAAKPGGRLYDAPQLDKADLVKGLHYLQTTDLRETAPLISCPTLILHGVADRVIPVAASHWLSEHIPNSRFVAFDGVGHDLPIRYCAAVANEVRKLIA